MPTNNSLIANIFDEIADILDIQGANLFRIRAYRQAARTVLAMPEDIAKYIENGRDLTALPTIGADLAEKIREIIDTGQCTALISLKSQSPQGLVELLDIPGLGPKRLNLLFKQLGIHNREQLLRAAKSGQLASLPGFGKKTQTNIIHAIEMHLTQKPRMKLSVATEYAKPFVAYLKKITGVEKVEIAGSYRRCNETVGDLDILVTAQPRQHVLDAFIKYREVQEVLATGPTRSSVILYCGLQVDLRVVETQSYGAALYYFTGSKAHNIALRQRARQRGLKINEYGVFRDNDLVAGTTEESVLASVDLPWIPPELRENNGEIEAAQSQSLPTLITLENLKGDLHSHTNATDGINSLTEMAAAARESGLEYLAITEHSKHLTVAHGLNEQQLLEHMDKIDKLNSQLKGITLLKGIEVDILYNGDLDLADETLAKLDLVIVAVHSNFHLSREKQTERLLRAMDNPYTTILAHPTGRLIGAREAYDIDMQRIIRHARQRGCFLELNAQPARLDLNAIHCQMAKAEGVLISINSDAHSVTDFDNLRYGVGQARRGWLEEQDILNTRSLAELRSLLRNGTTPPG